MMMMMKKYKIIFPNHIQIYNSIQIPNSMQIILKNLCKKSSLNVMLMWNFFANRFYKNNTLLLYYCEHLFFKSIKQKFRSMNDLYESSGHHLPMFSLLFHNHNATQSFRKNFYSELKIWHSDYLNLEMHFCFVAFFVIMRWCNIKPIYREFAPKCFYFFITLTSFQQKLHTAIAINIYFINFRTTKFWHATPWKTSLWSFFAQLMKPRRGERNN